MCTYTEVDVHTFYILPQGEKITLYKRNHLTWYCGKSLMVGHSGGRAGGPWKG